MEKRDEIETHLFDVSEFALPPTITAMDKDQFPEWRKQSFRRTG